MDGILGHASRESKIRSTVHSSKYDDRVHQRNEKYDVTAIRTTISSSSEHVEKGTRKENLSLRHQIKEVRFVFSVSEPSTDSGLSISNRLYGCSSAFV